MRGTTNADGGGNKGEVSVTSDGVKTYKQLLNSLNALIDYSKLDQNSKLSIDGYYKYLMTSYGTISYWCADNYNSNQNEFFIEIIFLHGSGSFYSIKSMSGTYTDITSQVPANGRVLKVLY